MTRCDRKPDVVTVGWCTGRGEVITGEQVDEVSPRQLHKQEEVTENVSDKDKGPRGPPFSVLMARWLECRCMTAVLASSEPSWLETALAMLCNSRRRVGRLGVG
jgi:hypothetical protein